MSEDNKKAWCGFNGWKPVAHTYDGAAYMAPIQANEEACSKIRETISNAKNGEFYVFDADGNASIAIGDTPEQPVDGIMIDDKFVTSEDVRKMQSERDALAATVEALRVAALNAIHRMSGGEAKADLRDAYDATPRQHLRDVRAEVVTECQLIVARATTTYRENPGMGFSSTIEDKTARQLKQEIAKELEQYAERVKAGEK